MILGWFWDVSWPQLPKMGSDTFEILTSNAIPLIQAYMLQLLFYYQEMVEIQSKNRFLDTF